MITASLATALALLLTGSSSVLACTTAESPRPAADYRAAIPVVVGTIEAIGTFEVTVRVEAVYRGAVGDRLRLAPPGPVDGW